MIDYMVRLFENKEAYKLTSIDIANLLNAESGCNFGESAYRKEYAAFNRGRIYERSLNDKGVVQRILSISDLHVPYQLPVETFSKYQGRVDVLVLNGDITDNTQISRFPKQYRTSPIEEIIQTRAYLIDLIEFIHPKKVVAIPGNHDMRFASYLQKNIDNELLELMPDTSLELIFEDGIKHYDKRNRTKVWYEPLKQVFTDIDIEYINTWKVKIGRTWFAHPFAFSSGTLKTCEKAMNHFFKTDPDGFSTVVLGHTHRTAESKNGFINLYEQGCCCDISKLRYGEGQLTDPQKCGYLYVCHDKNGDVIKEKTILEYLN